MEESHAEQPNRAGRNRSSRFFYSGGCAVVPRASGAQIEEAPAAARLRILGVAPIDRWKEGRAAQNAALRF